MAMAVRDEAELRRMAFDLEVEEDWPPVSVETLWVKAIAEHKFRIDSAPFFVNGIAVGDAVEGEVNSEGQLRFSGKLEGGGHSTIRVILIADESGRGIKEEIKRLGGKIEGSPWSALFSVDVPDREILAEVHRLLDFHTAAGDIEYENACLSELSRSLRLSCQSFTAGTAVLLAGGRTEAISTLRPGQKVLAADTRTGRNQAETITAVLVHHDTGLYDLKIRSGTKTAVIHTTSSHLFWVPGTGRRSGRWVKAASLKYGTRLRAPSGQVTVAVGGWTPAHYDGWMWDLTITPSHDFYITAAAAPVLVHNCDINTPQSFSGTSRADAEQELQDNGWENAGPTKQGGGIRWRMPGNISDQVRIMPGNPDDPNIIKQGPYIRFSMKGAKYGPYPLGDFNGGD